LQCCPLEGSLKELFRGGAGCLGAAVWAHGRLGAGPFGRRTFGRWHMRERKPWHIAQSEFQLLFHQRIIFTNPTSSCGGFILINTPISHIKQEFFA